MGEPHRVPAQPTATWARWCGPLRSPVLVLIRGRVGAAVSRRAGAAAVRRLQQRGSPGLASLVYPV